jgi:hypothetical protein
VNTKIAKTMTRSRYGTKNLLAVNIRAVGTLGSWLMRTTPAKRLGKRLLGAARA